MRNACLIETVSVLKQTSSDDEFLLIYLIPWNYTLEMIGVLNLMLSVCYHNKMESTNF